MSRQSQSNTNNGFIKDSPSMKLRNDQLVRENEILRDRVILLKKNSALRAANVMAEVVSWIDNFGKTSDISNKQTPGRLTSVGSNTRHDTNYNASNESSNYHAGSFEEDRISNNVNHPKAMQNNLRFEENRLSTVQQHAYTQSPIPRKNFDVLEEEKTESYQYEERETQQSPAFISDNVYRKQTEKSEYYSNDGQRYQENVNRIQYHVPGHHAEEPDPNRGNYAVKATSSTVSSAFREPRTMIGKNYAKNEFSPSSASTPTPIRTKYSSLSNRDSRYDSGIGTYVSNETNTYMAENRRGLKQDVLKSNARSPPPRISEPVASRSSPTYTSVHSPEKNLVPPDQYDYHPSVNGSLSWNVNMQKNRKDKATPIKHTARIIGEICFQLDRKILTHVFQYCNEKKKRFYGYTIQNIGRKIDKDCIVDGVMDMQKKNVLMQRHEALMDVLKPLGYDISIHPDFCADMVNKYGLLPVPQNKDRGAEINMEQVPIILDMLNKYSANKELHHLLIILDCLVRCSKLENQPLISY